VFIAHCNHGTWHDPDDRTNESCSTSPGWDEIPNHTGYDYFQRQLARMGIVAVGVYSNHANCRDWSVNTIVRRAEVVIGSIRHFRDADGGGDPIFGGRLDFDRVGLMVAANVVAMEEAIALGEANRLAGTRSVTSSAS
jgi:hypothetical protein